MRPDALTILDRLLLAIGLATVSLLATVAERLDRRRGCQPAPRPAAAPISAPRRRDPS